MFRCEPLIKVLQTVQLCDNKKNIAAVKNCLLLEKVTGSTTFPRYFRTALFNLHATYIFLKRLLAEIRITGHLINYLLLLIYTT